MHTDPTPSVDPGASVPDCPPALLSYWDADLHCRFASPGHRYWFGKLPDAMPGMHLQDLFGGPWFDLHRRFVDAALAGHEQRFESVLTAADGVVATCAVRYTPDSVDGKVHGFLTQLRARPGAGSAEVNAALAGAGPAAGGSWEWEVHADITIWSAPIYALFAYNPALLPPRFAQQQRFYTPASWQVLQAAVTLAVREGRPFAVPLEFFRPDTGTAWLVLQGEAEHDESGNVALLRGSMTPLLQATTVPDTAAPSAERTQAIEHARRMIALGHLTASSVHDLNNCLAIVASAAKLLEHHIAEPHLRPLVAHCVSGTARCAAITRRLLDMARTGDSTAGPIEVQDAIGACLDLLTAALGPSIDLRCDFSASRWIAVDRTLFDIALLNLAMNARDAMPDGGTLTIGVHLAAEARVAGASLEISLTDTGTGMTAEVLACATTAFFTTKAHGAGTGLGLDMVSEFARGAGGVLHLRSELGRGTTATICLPPCANPGAGLRPA